MKRFLLAAFAAAACLVGSVVPAVAATPTRILSHPEQVVLADNGRVVVMGVDGRFTVALGEGPTWTVETSDSSVLSRLPNFAMVRGAQGIYAAQKAGVVTLTATGVYPCQLEVPACKIASPFYRLTVVVQPVPSVQAAFPLGSARYTLQDMVLRAEGPAFIDHDRSFVTATALANALGSPADGMSYDPQTGVGSLTTHGSVPVKFQVGSSQLQVGSVTIEMDVAPQNKDGVLYLPVRWVAEALGAKVGWDGSSRTATLGAP